MDKKALDKQKQTTLSILSPKLNQAAMALDKASNRLFPTLSKNQEFLETLIYLNKAILGLKLSDTARTQNAPTKDIKVGVYRALNFLLVAKTALNQFGHIASSSAAIYELRDVESVLHEFLNTV